MDRKNLIIAILVGLLVLGSLWGQVGNKTSKDLRHELEQAEEQLSTVESTNSQTHDAVLTKTAALQKTLQGKEQQLNKARKELVALRKANKGLEARVSELESTVHKLTNENKQLAGTARNDDNGQVAQLEAKIVDLQKELKKDHPRVASVQSAVIIQLADAQKKVLTLNKELKEKDRLLAQKQTGEVGEQVRGLQKEIKTLQLELKKKDQQLVLASKRAERVVDLEKQLSELQGKEGAVVTVVEGVTPIQFAYFQAALKKKDMQMAQALRSIAELEKRGTAELEKKGADLETKPKLEKKTGRANVKQFVRVHTHEKDQEVVVRKKPTCLQSKPNTPKQHAQDKVDKTHLILDLQNQVAKLQAALKAKDKVDKTHLILDLQNQIAKLQAELKDKHKVDRTNLILDLQNQISTLQAELKDKTDQLADKSVPSCEISEQVISHLQKNIASLQGELKKKDERYNRARSAYDDYIADFKIKLTGLDAEIKSRGERIALLEKELQAGKQVGANQVKVDQDVARLEKELAEARAMNQKLEQAVKSVEQDQAARIGSDREIETAKAQIIGLEKIVEEKNIVIEELSQNLDKVKINMDILLNKIADQQDAVQEVQETNRELVKELSAKNAEVANLQEQIQEGQGKK